ncbi:F-box protein-like protein isoform X1 [Salvia divinorum]|uniref:F-box protein-like protein isoform X1 n=1 Tax=Salvia divinorum TaxID=28513 RepID=A0ABD1I907_SALDI
MTFSPDKENQHSSPSPRWFKSKKAFNNVLFAMRLNNNKQQPLTPKSTNQNIPPPSSRRASKIHHFPPTDLVLDKTSLLSDQILLKILSNLPKSQRDSNCLVSKRWLNLQGRLVTSIKLLDWYFLVSGRLLLRFPNLVKIDLVNGCILSPQNLGVSVTNELVSFHGGSDCFHRRDWFSPENYALSGEEIDRGVRVLAAGFPNLTKLVVMNATEMGVLTLAEECPKLQELELRMCSDRVLRGIAACQNLQILQLSGSVSDVGLIILAQGCKKLTKLELNGCRGGYEGVKAIGQCCSLLDELTLTNLDMEDGWMLGLPFCESLKSLRLVSCKKISSDVSDKSDANDDDDDLGYCPVIKNLRLDKCQMRDKKSLTDLFLICRNARELVLQSCWGLSDEVFGAAAGLRRVRCVSIQGCALLTARGLESVIVGWSELRSLKVVACNNIKDEEINPEVSTAFAELKWEPDSRSRLCSGLAGTGVGRKGGKFFNKSCDWKSFRSRSDS